MLWDDVCFGFIQIKWTEQFVKDLISLFFPSKFSELHLTFSSSLLVNNQRSVCIEKNWG